MAAWEAWEAAPTGPQPPLGFILSMEGADPIVSPEQVPQWWDDGLRIVSLSHYGISATAHGTDTEGGLTPLGRPMLRALDEAGIILDLTHLADARLLRGAGRLRRAGAGQPQQLPGARPRRAPVHRRSDSRASSSATASSAARSTPG